MADLKDFKDWIQEEAEERALEVYDTEFCNLPKETQDELYALATEAYKDAYAGSIDKATDLAK